MLVVLALVWIISGILLWRGNRSAQMPTRYLAILRRLEAANPEGEAEAAVRNNDLRLLMVERADIGQRLPGVTNPADRARFPVRIIPIPFDAPDAEQKRIQHIAFDYAFRYNVALLKAVGVDRQTRPSTTQGAAGTAATTQASH
jgi:hypothetical protein